MTILQFADIQTKSQIIKAEELHIELPSQPVKYYRHGWQSWSLAAWTDLNPLPVQKPAIFHPLQVDAEHVLDPNPNGAWLGAAEFADGSVVLLGALGLDAYVSLGQNQLSGRCDTEAVEWFIAHGQEQVIFGEYVRRVGHPLRANPKRCRASRLVLVVQPVHDDRRSHPLRDLRQTQRPAL